MDIHVLDTHHLGHKGVIAATALRTPEGLALFDVGPESTFEQVAAELRTLGFSSDDVRHAFLSHIHFDHAGAAWRFAELGATIYVHPRGAPHLLDPAKLINSATRLFGADMERLWGKIMPVAPERLRVVEDGDTIRLGDIEVRAMATPGHASHHHVYCVGESVFAGDVAGVRIGHGPPVPPFVPPELQIESWRESISKIRALHPARLCLPHFGVFEHDVRTHLDLLEERVCRWAEWFRDRLRAGITEPEMRAEFAAYEHADLRQAGATEHDAVAYEHADPSYMAVPAAERYWRKFHPAEVAASE